jgi:hypothetical protein
LLFDSTDGDEVEDDIESPRLSAKIFLPPDFANKRGANGGCCCEIDEASNVLETVF